MEERGESDLEDIQRSDDMSDSLGPDLSLSLVNESLLNGTANQTNLFYFYEVKFILLF